MSPNHKQLIYCPYHTPVLFLFQIIFIKMKQFSWYNITMIQPIIHDEKFLSLKSKKATNKDKQIIQDLKDTLKEHSQECVGMAANMIGQLKNIIIVHTDMKDLILINPKIIKKSNPYFTKEGCLSLLGERETKRFQTIEVEYLTENFIKTKSKFIGFTAQIIQHEIDHCNGILI